MIVKLTTLFLFLGSISAQGMSPRHELTASFGAVTQTVHLPVATVTVTILPSITTQTSLSTMRPPPVTVTSTYSPPTPTTSPSPTTSQPVTLTRIPSQTSSSSPSSTNTRSPEETSKAAEHPRKPGLASDKIMIIVAAVVLVVLTAVGLGVGWYRGFYLPKKQKEEEKKWKERGLKPLRLQAGPTPGTPRVVSMQPV